MQKFRAAEKYEERKHPARFLNSGFSTVLLRSSWKLLIAPRDGKIMQLIMAGIKRNQKWGPDDAKRAIWTEKNSVARDVREEKKYQGEENTAQAGLTILIIVIIIIIPRALTIVFC